MPTVKKWNSFASDAERFRPVRDRYTRRIPLQLHTHQYMEITCIDRGRALHFVNGLEHVVEPGSLLFIRASDLHSLLPLGAEALELTNIAIPVREYRLLLKRYPDEMKWAFREREKEGFSTVLEPSRQPLFSQWVDELFDAPRDRALALDRFMINVLALLTPRAEEIGPAVPDWLAHTWREIRKPEAFAEGVGALFRLAGRSREHVARELKRHFGLTPSDCVRQARMRHAARMLEMTTRPILEISLECGFRDLAHFYKAFRQHHHATPRQYRVSHRIR